MVKIATSLLRFKAIYVNFRWISWQVFGSRLFPGYDNSIILADNLGLARYSRLNAKKDLHFFDCARQNAPLP